jgi:hypothetical protein
MGNWVTACHYFVMFWRTDDPEVLAFCRVDPDDPVVLTLCCLELIGRVQTSFPETEVHSEYYSLVFWNPSSVVSEYHPCCTNYLDLNCHYNISKHDQISTRHHTTHHWSQRSDYRNIQSMRGGREHTMTSECRCVFRTAEVIVTWRATTECTDSFFDLRSLVTTMRTIESGESFSVVSSCWAAVILPQ